MKDIERRILAQLKEAEAAKTNDEKYDGLLKALALIKQLGEHGEDQGHDAVVELVTVAIQGIIKKLEIKTH